MTEGWAPVGEPAVRGIVGHAHLDDLPAGGAHLDEQLGREEGTARFDPDAFERGSPEELAGAVHVADPETEPDAIRELVEPGVDRADRRIGPPDAVADDGVRGIGLVEPGNQPTEVGNPKLAIPVGEADEVVAGRPEARTERRTVAQVHRVVDRADDVRMGAREAVGDGRGPVLRAVVDGDDLEAVRESRQRDQGLLHERLEVGLLVVGREEVREGGDAGRRVEAHGAIVAARAWAVAERMAVTPRAAGRSPGRAAGCHPDRERSPGSRSPGAH